MGTRQKGLETKAPRGSYVVRLGRCDVPVACLSSRGLNPLNSHRGLVKYIEKNGSYQEVWVRSKDEAVKLCAEFKVPVNSLWFNEVIHIAEKEGLPDEQLFFNSGIRN